MNGGLKSRKRFSLQKSLSQRMSAFSQWEKIQKKCNFVKCMFPTKPKNL